MAADHGLRPDKGTPLADADWHGGRRWTGIGAVGVLILVVLALVLVLTLSHHHTAATTAPVATGPASAATTTGSVPVVLPTAVPTTAPTGTVWTLYATEALPHVTGAGPTQVNGAIATGYARTPEGALAAAVNEGSLYRLAPDSSYRAAALAMTAPGVGRNAWLANRAANPYGPTGGVGQDTLSQMAGFQYVSYSPADAVIQLAFRNNDSAYQAVNAHVTWLNGDWRYVLAPDGGDATSLQKLDSLTGFIPWAGV